MAPEIEPAVARRSRRCNARRLCLHPPPCSAGERAGADRPAHDSARPGHAPAAFLESPRGFGPALSNRELTGRAHRGDDLDGSRVPSRAVAAPSDGFFAGASMDCQAFTKGSLTLMY